jgi:hypothetical protein
LMVRRGHQNKTHTTHAVSSLFQRGFNAIKYLMVII